MEDGFGDETPKTLSHWQLVVDHCRITPEVRTHQYNGRGTEDDPLIVTWLPHDPRNPMEFSPFKR
jgi:MFS family permease